MGYDKAAGFERDHAAVCSGRGFSEKFLNDVFNFAGFQTDGADDAFAVHDGVGGKRANGPTFGDFEFGVARGGIDNAVFFRVGDEFFLSALRRANAKEYQTLAFVFLDQFVVLRDGGHAWSAPGGVKIYDDDFAFDVRSGDAAVNPLGEPGEGGHGLAFKRDVAIAIRGVG